MSEIVVRDIQWGTKEYEDELALRNEILRVPLGLNLYKQDRSIWCFPSVQSAFQEKGKPDVPMCALADGSISLSLSATPLRGRVVPSTKPELSRPKPRESPLSNTQKAPPPPPRLSRGAFSRCLQQGGRCGDDHPGLLLPPVQPPVAAAGRDAGTVPRQEMVLLVVHKQGDLPGLYQADLLALTDHGAVGGAVERG